jgi:hypothetical protein
MKTATTECKRCGGAKFLAHYRHVANGVCFACGRRLGGVAVAAPRRAEIINEIAKLLRQLTEAGRNWTTDGEESYPTLGALEGWLEVAPEDVKARAVAAFERIAA